MPNVKANFFPFESELKKKLEKIWNAKNPSQSNIIDNPFFRIQVRNN